MAESPSFIEPTAPQDAPATTPAAPAGPPDGDKGFPEGTALAQMSEAEQLAYWKHHAQKHENLWQKAAKATHGLTPQEIADLQAKVETLETEKLSATDKALKQARDEAAESAAEAARSEYLPQIQALQVKSIASQIISGDKLNAFMQVVNPAALVGKDGNVDEAQIMGVLTAMYGTDPAPTNGQRHQNFGQYSTPPPRGAPGQNGTAEAQKRFGVKT